MTVRTASLIRTNGSRVVLLGLVMIAAVALHPGIITFDIRTRISDLPQNAQQTECNGNGNPLDGSLCGSRPSASNVSATQLAPLVSVAQAVDRSRSVDAVSTSGSIHLLPPNVFQGTPPQPPQLVAVDAVDITPVRKDKIIPMFCAVLTAQDGQYVGVHGNRPAKDMTVYTTDRRGSAINVLFRTPAGSPLDTWEDPRLVRRDDGLVLVTVQMYGRPIGVARLYVDPTNLSNVSFGPISRVSLNDAPKLATKNWAPFFHDGSLHFVVAVFPLIVARCDSVDDITWSTCSLVVGGAAFRDAKRVGLSRFQLNLVFRGGSQLVPWPGQDGEPNTAYAGFLHSRLKCCRSNWLHRPHVIVIRAAPTWSVVHVSGPINGVFPMEMNLWRSFVQDPVAVASVDRHNGDVTVSMNVGDTVGKCMLVTIPNAFKVDMNTPVNITLLRENRVRELEAACDDLERRHVQCHAYTRKHQ